MTVFRAKEIFEFAFLIQRMTESGVSAQDPSPVFSPVYKPVQASALECAGRFSIGHDVSKRKSNRTFEGPPSALHTAKAILRESYGFASEQHRTVPSAGAYYPLQLTLVKIENGMTSYAYHYDPYANELLPVDIASNRIRDGFDVYHVDFDGITWMVLWSCQLARIASRYGARAYRYICFEIGHSAQMAVLACSMAGIEHVVLGGIREEWMRKNILRQGRKWLPQYSLVFR